MATSRGAELQACVPAYWQDAKSELMKRDRIMRIAEARGTHTVVFPAIRGERPPSPPPPSDI